MTFNPRELILMSVLAFVWSVAQGFETKVRTPAPGQVVFVSAARPSFADTAPTRPAVSSPGTINPAPAAAGAVVLASR
jgi:hypothetical protein